MKEEASGRARYRETVIGKCSLFILPHYAEVVATVSSQFLIKYHA